MAEESRDLSVRNLSDFAVAAKVRFGRMHCGGANNGPMAALGRDLMSLAQVVANATRPPRSAQNPESPMLRSLPTAEMRTFLPFECRRLGLARSRKLPMEYCKANSNRQPRPWRAATRPKIRYEQTSDDQVVSSEAKATSSSHLRRSTDEAGGGMILKRSLTDWPI